MTLDWNGVDYEPQPRKPHEPQVPQVLTDLYENCKPIDPALCELETVECTCGYHMGVDATYLDQVGTVKIPCPSCGEPLLIPEIE